MNYSNEIHDLSTVQDGAPSLAPSMYYQEKSLADFFPPHLPKKVRASCRETSSERAACIHRLIDDRRSI